MQHAIYLARALDAVEDVFKDISVPKETTEESLRTIRDVIDSRLETLG